jgi:hypothetical protein
MPPDAAPAPESLHAIYEALLAQITGGHAGPEAAMISDAAALVTGDARASAGERIHVYQHMYQARLVEALEAQFPRASRWLGAEAFAEVVAAYVADEPSRHPSLRFVGRRFPDWLAARAPAEARRPALADLARLEWAREDVFDAADETTLSLDTVRAWPLERFGEIPLRLVIAHRRLRLARPVAALWDAIGPAERAAEASVLDEAAAVAASAPDGESLLLVWRQGIAVFHRAVDTAEAAALDRIAQGTTFGAICEMLSHDRPEQEAVAQAFTWLSTWTADELLVAVS